MVEPLTLGVEEEFQIISARSLDLAPGYERLMRRATLEIRERMHQEYYQCVVECITAICPTIEDVRRQTAVVRATAATMASKSGLAIVSAGTHPRTHWASQPRSTDPTHRYAMLEEVIQDVARSITIYGLHVHVGIPDEAMRIAVMNQARTFLPYILALSANSPFWIGRLTGFQSFRTMVWAPFPMANMPDAFASLADYQAFHDLMARTGALTPPRRIWWDIRSHHTLPTLEYRIADMPMNHADMVAIVAFVQALTATILDRTRHGHPFPILPTSVLNENKWRAARWGLRGTFIDYARGEEVPAVEAIGAALDLVRHAFEQLGTEEQLRYLRGMLAPEYRTGAERQIAAYSKRNSLDDVVRLLMQETLRDIDLSAALPLAPAPVPFLARFRNGQSA